MVYKFSRFLARCAFGFTSGLELIICARSGLRIGYVYTRNFSMWQQSEGEVEAWACIHGCLFVH